jgi:hypothetical protein
MANGNAATGQSYPIARGFALIVLLALGVLIALRQLFGSVRVDVTGGLR